MTKEEREKYIKQICKDRGFSEEKTKKVVEKVQADAEADSDLADLYEGIYALPVKGSADYNRQLDELKAKAKKLDEWHLGANATVQQKTKLAEDLAAELAKFKEKYGELEDGEPTGKSKPGEPQGQNMTELINERDAYYLALMADKDAVVAEHFKMFGEIIDTTPLLRRVAEAQRDPVNPRQMSLRDAHNEIYHERIEKHQADQKAAEEKKLRDEGAQQERARMLKAGYKPTGATISESGSNLFHALKTEGDKKDPDRTRSEEEEIDLFTSELAQEMQKAEAAEA